MNALQSRALLVGRILVSALFIMSGLGKIGGWAQTAQMMEAKGVPMVPVLLAVTILLEVGGGLSLLLGYRTRFGALALILFLIPTTLVMHDFWSYQGMERTMQMVNFMKNFALIGMFTFPAVFGAGAISLDARREGGVSSAREEQLRLHRVA